MADLARLEQALINAHNAGDAAAAKIFAAEIRAMKAANPKPLTPPSGIVQGMRDPIDAGAQFLEKLLPQPAVDAINTANNWLADKTGLVDKLDSRGLSGQLADNEAAYQANREEGFDWNRLAGNVFSPANIALAARGPAVLQNVAGKLGGNVAANAFRPGGVVSNAAIGAGLGVMSSPVQDNDEFLRNKAIQAAGGAIGGIASPYIAAGAARVIDPVSKKATSVLRNSGVNPTIGQQAGGNTRRFEEMMKSSPWVGKMIENRQREAIQEFNDAVFNRALKPLGLDLPKAVRNDSPAALQYARRQIQQVYDDVLLNSKGALDLGYQQELSALRAGMKENGMDRKFLQRFDTFVKNKIDNRATTSGRMNGDNLKMVEEAIKDEAAKFQQSGDTFTRELGDAFEELGAIWGRMVARNNPANAEKLRAANRAYAEMKQAQRALSSVTNDQEIFTPAQYYSAIKAMDKTKDKRAFAEQTALNQDFGKIAKQALGNNSPDSNTAQRLNWTNATGLLATLPTAALAPLYTRPGQMVARQLLNQRFSDPAAEAIANAIRRNGNVLAMPGLSNLGSQGLLSL